MFQDLLLNTSKGYLKLLISKENIQIWSFCKKRNRWMGFILALLSVWASVLTGSWLTDFVEGSCWNPLELLNAAVTGNEIHPVQDSLGTIFNWHSCAGLTGVSTWAFYCRDGCFYFYTFAREGAVKIRHRELYQMFVHTSIWKCLPLAKTIVRHNLAQCIHPVL